MIITELFRAWTWRMAWRDTRASRRRLLLFSASIVMGVAALVAVRCLARSAERAIDDQSRTLLGADLSIGSRQALTAEEKQWFASLGGEQAQEIDFNSMIYFSKDRGTRLVSVRAISKEFPFYGKLEVRPSDAVAKFRAGRGLLVDASLIHQFQAQPGDEVRLGALTTVIAGVIERAPGESVVLASISPRVYLPIEQVPNTGLLRLGSFARYRQYFKFGEGTNVAKLVEGLRPELNAHRLSFNTVETRKEDLGRSIEDVYNYLNLAGFVALLLGGIGVASGIHVHVKQKLETVAVLRCLGAGVAQTFAIYVVEAILVGLIGGVIGAGLGIVLARLFPFVFKGFFPLAVEMVTDWGGVLEAIGQGLIICMLFALLPLLEVRRVSPLAAIRVNYQSQTRRFDWMAWGIYALIAGGIVFFCVHHSRVWRHGAAFALAVGSAFLILGGLSRLTVWTMRKLPLRGLPYVWRQGLANLYRPQNRTVLLVLSLGLGTFLILSIYLIQHALVAELTAGQTGNRPNIALFDIQADQKAGVMQLLRARKLPVLDEAPVVTMRLESIKGRRIEEILSDTNRTIPNWVLRREYRSTYGNRLRSGERIIAGRWPAKQTKQAVVPVSLERGIARDLGVRVGDEIAFDVQGIPVKAQVASLREVEWRRVQPNFYVLFPPGVLEDAPATHIVVSQVQSSEQSGELQRAIVESFPNVSAIDLTLILRTLDAVVRRISLAVQFMASFTILTGVLVLVGAVLSGRYQRMRESVLLRSLGAARAQVFQVLLAEYLWLGVVSASVGTVLAMGAAWGLSRYVFQLKSFQLGLWVLLTTVLALPLLTAIVGLLSSRGILTRPPLAVLRAE
jgi:putative ABC transport system permease protein